LNTLIQKYLGTILAAATIALVSGGVTHLFSFYALAERVTTMETAHLEDTAASKKREEDIQKTLGNVVDVLKQIVAQQEEFKGMILTPTVVGRGTVGDFGSEIPFVDINEYGAASMYLKAKAVTITCSVDGIEHSAQFVVRGSFRNRQDPQHLIMFSEGAAEELGVAGIVDRVSVGPVK